VAKEESHIGVQTTLGLLTLTMGLSLGLSQENNQDATRIKITATYLSIFSLEETLQIMT
jgi:hypothetical protein